jgi:hypothetical protein
MVLFFRQFQKSQTRKKELKIQMQKAKWLIPHVEHHVAR